MEEVLNNKKQSNGRGKNLLFTIFVVCAIVYIVFLLYQAVYFNYSTNQKIKQLKADQGELLKDKSRLETLIAYYQTDAFAELEARKKLGLKKPGELVIAVDLPENSQQPPTVFVEKPALEKSNLQSWIDYLSGRQ